VKFYFVGYYVAIRLCKSCLRLFFVRISVLLINVRNGSRRIFVDIIYDCGSASRCALLHHYTRIGYNCGLRNSRS